MDHLGHFAGEDQTPYKKHMEAGGQDPAERISAVINFNFYTSSPVLQTSMEVPVIKKTGIAGSDLHDGTAAWALQRECLALS